MVFFVTCRHPRVNFIAPDDIKPRQLVTHCGTTTTCKGGKYGAPVFQEHRIFQFPAVRKPMIFFHRDCLLSK